MPQVRLFSDSDSFTAIYASGEHKGDAKGVLLTGNNMVTHYLVIPEKVAKLNGIPRIQEAIEINTPDGKLVAVPYQQPFKLVDYVAGHEAYWTPKNSIRIAAISALESKEKYGFDGGGFGELKPTAPLIFLASEGIASLWACVKAGGGVALFLPGVS